MKHMMIKVLSLVMALTMIMGMFGAVALSAAEHVHTKGDKVKTVAPTCVAYGYTLYECADCGETYADDILAKTEECQNIVDVKEVAATCTSNAITAGKQCADCGTYIEGGEEIPGTMLEHKMVIAITQPTCDADGEVYEYCSLCNKNRKQLRNLAALGENGEHVTAYEITKAPSCGESGLATWGCTLCDEYTVEGIYVAPNPDLHVWDKVDDKPTCTSAGFKGWECTECWNTTTVDPETGVELVDGGLLAPYDHKNDYVEIDETNYEGYAFFINNEFKPEDLKLAATCDKDGFHYIYCNDCEEVIKVIDKAYVHSFEKWFDKDNNVQVAEYVVKEVAPTCEASGYVVVKCDNYNVCDCEETKTIITKDPLNKDHKHNWHEDLRQATKGTKWDIVEATCTTAGYTWKKCTNSGCNEIKRFDAIDALGHNYEYRCAVCVDKDGVEFECLDCQHDRELVCVANDERDGCSATKAVTKPAAHDISTGKDVITVPATCSSYAYDTHYCKNKDCGYKVNPVVDDNGNIIYDTEAGYDADNHSDLKKMVITNPTCLTEGKARYSCYNCSVGAWDEVLPVLEDHEEYRTVVEAVAATCTYKGVGEYIKCAKCETLDLAYFKGLTRADNGVKEEVPAGYGYVKAPTNPARNYSNHETEGAVETFYRPGSCTIVELHVYTCGRAACNNAKFNVEGELDIYNHNKYVYVDNLLDESKSSTTLTEAPAGVAAETHWGACIEYKPAFYTCLDDGYHANLKCTSCKEVVGVTPYDYKATLTDASGKVILYEELRDTNNSGSVSGSDMTCPICKNWESTGQDMDGNGTKEWEPSPHITYEYFTYDDGSYVPGTNKGKSVKTRTVTLVLPATGHTFKDIPALDEECDKPGHTAGKDCTNAWPKNIAATKDDDTTNDDACGYKEGQKFIPAHGDSFKITYAGKAPTCSSYGVGIQVTANVYQNNRYQEFVVIPQIVDATTWETIYEGQVLVLADDGVYKVVEAKAVKTTDVVIVDEFGNINDPDFTLIADDEVAAIGGKWCAKCEDKKDITLRAYYIAPLAHEYVINTIANSCTDFGWTEFKCSQCTANGPHWIDRDGDNVVDVELVYDTVTGALDTSVLELSWFITEFEYADGHKFLPEFEKVEEVTDIGWIVMGEILSDFEFDYIKNSGFESVLGALNPCTVDRIKYVQCACGEKKAVGDVIPATGHYMEQTDGSKTYISMDCDKIDKWIGYTCDGCFTVINKEDTVPSHDLVHVYLAETCTKEGLENCWACVNCDDHFAVLADGVIVENMADGLYEASRGGKTLSIVTIDFTPTEDEADANKYNGLTARDMEDILEAIVLPVHTPSITEVKDYVPETATEDGYWEFICRKCGETVREPIEADAELIFNVTIEDVNGSKVTANGNEIVVKVAYTAKAYNFRALNLGFKFDNAALTFNKSEVKGEYADVQYEVNADEDEINALFYVPNGLKKNATLTGENVDFLYFYFTVNTPDTIDITTFYLDECEAKYYDEVAKTNEIQTQFVDIANPDYELEVGVTGDVDGNFDIDYSDLLDMMDIVYTADAKYVAVADINKDGVVDVEDFAALSTFVGTKQTAADYAEMMGVELPDYETLVLQILNIEKLDINGDDKINKADVDALCSDPNFLSVMLDYIVNKLDEYDAWTLFFLANPPAGETEVETIDKLTDLVIAAYQMM